MSVQPAVAVVPAAEKPDSVIQSYRLVPAAASKELTPKESKHWVDKGALYATYGNDSAAIKCFKKAIALDPQNAEAFFNLGISYAGKHEYADAIKAVNRALAIDPENGRYLYGRGWIYLLSGDNSKAMADMKEAAELGNPDARQYLKDIAPRGI